ncbi:MAG: hypothetical protein IJD30_05745 [Clostridia bacterium]|nr:hypothetical protein [Clostridia bacterium]
MKKILYLLAIYSIMMSLVACGGGKKADSKNKLEEVKEEYVVNIDDSFESGIELESARVTLSPEEADFRNLKWEMTKDEVIYTEGTGFTEPKANVMYYTRVREEDYPADAEYTFVDGKLAQGIFYITNNKEGSNIGVEDYNVLVDSLKARFGEPDTEVQHYYDETVKTDDTSKHAELIMQNKLNYRTLWSLDDTELRVVMINNRGELCIGLQYRQAGVTIPTE